MTSSIVGTRGSFFGSFGVATLQKQHVKLGPENLLVFDYPAKSGKRRVQAVVDSEVYDVVFELKRRRGGSRELLAYRNGGGFGSTEPHNSRGLGSAGAGAGNWVDLRSDEINAYIKDATGGDFSAKHFRTWHGTVIAAVALAVSGGATARTARTRAMTRAAREVAHYLGNTPAIARASYIDPRVFDCYQAGVTIAASLDGLGDAELGAPATHGRIERAVYELLSGWARARDLSSAASASLPTELRPAPSGPRRGHARLHERLALRPLR